MALAGTANSAGKVAYCSTVYDQLSVYATPRVSLNATAIVFTVPAGSWDGGAGVSARTVVTSPDLEIAAVSALPFSVIMIEFGSTCAAAPSLSWTRMGFTGFTPVALTLGIRPDTVAG